MTIPKITDIAITKISNKDYISISLPISLYNNAAKEQKTIVRDFKLALKTHLHEVIEFNDYFCHDIEYVELENGKVDIHNLKHTKIKPVQPIIINGTQVEFLNLGCISNPGKYQFSEGLFKLRISFNTSNKYKNINYYTFNLSKDHFNKLVSIIPAGETQAEPISQVLDIPLSKITKNDFL